MAEEKGNKLVVKARHKGGVEYTNGMFRIDKCIASYPHLDEPHAGEDGGTPKFSIQGLLDKEEHSGIIDAMRNACRRIMDEKKTKVSGDKLFLKDGDKYFEDKEECKGRYNVSARENTRPVLRNAAGAKLDPKTDMPDIKELFYGGAIVSILINPWYQDNKYGKRINANLRAVRFVEDGTPFGEGRVGDDDAWDDDDYDNSGAGNSGDWDDDDI
jgi:hypothetical protein